MAPPWEPFLFIQYLALYGIALMRTLARFQTLAFFPPATQIRRIESDPQQAGD